MKKRKGWQRKGKKDRHHNLAKSRGGNKSKKNISLLDIAHHEAFHFLFGNRTYLEAAAVLKRLSEMKERKYENKNQGLQVL